MNMLLLGQPSAKRLRLELRAGDKACLLTLGFVFLFVSRLSAQRFRAQRCRAQKQLRLSIITSGGLIMINMNEEKGGGQYIHIFMAFHTTPGQGPDHERSDIKRGYLRPSFWGHLPLLPWEAVSLPRLRNWHITPVFSFSFFFSAFPAHFIAQHNPPDNL